VYTVNSKKDGAEKSDCAGKGGLREFGEKTSWLPRGGAVRVGTVFTPWRNARFPRFAGEPFLEKGDPWGSQSSQVKTNAATRDVVRRGAFFLVSRGRRAIFEGWGGPL